MLVATPFFGPVHAAEIVPDPKPANVTPNAPTPGVISVPGAEPEAEAPLESEPAFAPPEPLPHSGVGGVIVDPGIEALDVTNAMTRLAPASAQAGGATFASYLIDFVNPSPAPQTRIIVLDPGVYGGPGAPATLSAPKLETALSSDANAPVDILDRGVRPRIRIVVPGNGTVTAAFRFSAPLNYLTAEMWDERALAHFDTAALVMQGALLGLLTALGAWLAGIAILRRDRLAGWLTALFAASFLALLAGFGFTGPFAVSGVLLHSGLALGLFALSGALALAFVVHAVAPDGRWPGFAWIAAYAPWLAAALGLLVLFNAPYGAAAAKAAAVLSLGLSVILVFARAWEGEGAARRLTFAAVFVLIAFAPLAMLETAPSSGRIGMLAASGLLATALLMAAFATASGSPIALRQRVDRVLGYPLPPPALPLPTIPVSAAQTAASQDARYGLALAAAHQGLWDWDLARDRLFLSPSVEVLLGARPGALAAPGRDWAAHIHEDDIATFLSALEEYRRIGDVSFALDFRGRGLDGLYRWIQLRASFMSDGDRAARCVGLASDVSAQKDSEALLLASARQDAVTGLANRAFLLEALGHRLAFAAPDRRYALLTFDLVRFRTVNDGLGHVAGDALLATVADRLRAAIPDHALPARLGGDLFAVVWPADDADAAAEAAKLALDAISPVTEIAGQRIVPLARGGLVMLDGVRSAAAALGDAEAALAEARRLGAGSIVLFASEMGDAKSRRAVLERDLGGALERGEILIHYQPIVRVADRRLAGFEALLRWKHPDRGLLSAEEFVGLAEETGAIAALDVFALGTAARDLARWHSIAPADPTLFVNANLSARHLLDENFIAACENVGAAQGLPRGAMHLEITETLEIEEGGMAERALMRLRRAGYTLVMDDFGAGHSTPRRLAHLPFDSVKIDRSFLAGGAMTRSVLAGLFRLAHDLGLDVTAEGVESEDDFAFLASQHCAYAQGYHCGAAMDETGARAAVMLAYGVADAEAGE